MTAAEAADRPARLVRAFAHPVVKLALPLLIVGIATFVLHKLASSVHWSDVQADVAATSWITLLIAAGATFCCYLAFAAYDMLGVLSVARGKVPMRIAGVAGASGFAISNLLGYSYLTGTAVRYRIYSALGLDLVRVAGIASASMIGFTAGLVLILGVLLTAHPAGLSNVVPISGWVETGLGVVLLIGFLTVIVWLSRGQRQLTVGGEAVKLPSLPIAIGLTAAAVLDLVGSAMTLYVLMPADLAHNFAFFFVVYVGAVAFGVISTSPGGLGVFEATIIAGFGAAGRSDVLAALLLYRMIFTLMPFLIAATGLSVAWLATRRETVAGGLGLTHRIVRPLVPLIAAGISLFAGILLLVSGNLPSDSSRLAVLRDILPLGFVEASHLLGSIVGLLLIVISRGLYLRRHRAWVAAMLLMAVGLATALARGLDWEEAVVMLATIAILGVFRSAFYRADDGALFRLSGGWIVAVLGLMAVAFWVGLFAYSHVEYQNTLWWQFAWHGDASRFLRVSLVVALVFGVLLVNSLVSGGQAKIRAEDIPDAVRRLVAESGDTDACIALSGDKAFLVSENERAFLAYADSGRTLIARGDPVGDPGACRDLIWDLREQADALGRRCAFYSVSSAFLPTYLDLGFSILKIGEVGRVDLGAFSFAGSKKKDLRYARSRAEREGYEFAVIAAGDLQPALPALRRISDAWLAAKHGAEKSFSLGAFGEDYLSNFDHAVLRETATGEVVAFANLFQGAGKHELSLDLMRYDPAGPNFAMDALFGELLAWGQAQGFKWFSLGAAPLSGLENRRFASSWNRIGGFAFEHGERFYNFEGLRAFKEKFEPEWTPNYLASPGGLAVPRILYEVSILISGGVRGLVK